MAVQKLRIIFVHGACHGAWSWHKVVEALRSEGHSAVALDLAGSGLDRRRIPEHVSTLEEYSQPLMETVATLPEGEKAVLVGHSHGGLSLALAMETFPGKIAVAVFVTAFMPDTTHPPAHVFDKLAEHIPSSAWKDTEFKEVRVHGRDEPFTTMLFGPRFMEENLYQLCTPQMVCRQYIVGTDSKSSVRFVPRCYADEVLVVIKSWRYRLNIVSTDDVMLLIAEGRRSEGSSADGGRVVGTDSMLSVPTCPTKKELKMLKESGGGRFIVGTDYLLSGNISQCGGPTGSVNRAGFLL